MADNLVADAGSGGGTIAFDDISSVMYQRVKLIQGADGTNDGDVSSAAPLCTQLRSEQVDDAAFTPATSRVMMIGATLDDSAPDSVNEGDGGALRMAANRCLYVNIRDNAGNERGLNVDSSGNITVNVTGTVTVGSHAVTNAGTFAVQVDGTALTRLTDIETNTDSCAVVGNGAASTAQRVTLANDSTGIVALTTSTASIGKLASNSGVTIGAVEIAAAQTLATVTTVSTVTNLATIGTSVTPGTSAAHLGKAEDAVHSSGDTGVFVLAVRSDTAASTGQTDGDYSALVTDSSGRLHVNVGNTVTVGSHAVTNAGTFAVQVDGNALTALQLIDDPVVQDDGTFTPGTTKVMMAGFEADEASTDSVDEGDAGAARMTLDRKLIVTQQPHTAGGLSIARDIDLDNGTLTVVKNAAGQLYGWDITNTSTATVFVKFYDATSGTLGTGTPVLTIGIPGNSTDDTLSSKLFANGVAFGTGICVGAGTGVADADNTDPGANACVANIYYK